eukprot:gene45808-56066_t
MASIFIDGESGTTGLQIRARLENHPTLTICSIAEHERKDPAAKRRLMEEVDAVVLCLPDAGAKEVAAMAAEMGDAAPKLLDASTAHRVNPDWVYGFPELTEGHAAKIAAAKRVANPGCYPTGGIALLRPLVERLKVPKDCRALAEVCAREHGNVHQSGGFGAQAVVRLLRRCDAWRAPQRFAELLLACECDARGRLGLEDRDYPQRARLQQ